MTTAACQGYVETEEVEPPTILGCAYPPLWALAVAGASTDTAASAPSRTNRGRLRIHAFNRLELEKV
jgi:hypothetical protein